VKPSFYACLLLLLPLRPAAQEIICASASGPSWKCIGPVHTRSDINTVGRINALYVSPSQPALMYAGSKGGGLWKTTDGGASWKNCTEQTRYPSMGALGMAVAPGTEGHTVYLSGSNGYITSIGQSYSEGVYKSTDGGSSWKRTGLSFAPEKREKVYALSTGRTNGQILCGLSLEGALTYRVYTSVNGGKSWEDAEYPAPSLTLGSLLFHPGNDKIIYVSGQKLWRYSLKQKEWKDITASLPGTLHSRPSIVLNSAGNILYALYRSTAGYLMGISSDGGASWKSYSNTNLSASYLLEASYHRFVVSPANPQVIYVADGNSVVYKSTNGGAHFYPVTLYNRNGTHCDIKALELVSASADGNRDVLVIGTDGGVMKSLNGGKDWQSLAGDMNAVQLVSVSGSGTVPEVVTGAALDNDIFNNRGGTWNVRIRIGDGCKTLFNKYNPAQAFAQSPSDFYFSRDSGMNSEPLAAPLYKPRIPDPKPFRAPMLVEGRNLYVGCSDIYRKPFDTLTASWKRISDFRALQRSIDTTLRKPLAALAVAQGEQTIYAALEEPYYKAPPVRCKLFKTTDGGLHWEDISNNLFDKISGHWVLQWWNITDIAINPENPEEIWVSIGQFTADKKVYYSQDGGQSWENYSAGLPNYPVNCLLYEEGSNNRILAGTDTGVYYRDASMGQWECYGHGLPSILITELHINYRNRTLKAATLGRGIWEAKLY
jgi:photosystem II stability/assembly factor-like uncharacterized protein